MEGITTAVLNWLWSLFQKGGIPAVMFFGSFLATMWVVRKYATKLYDSVNGFILASNASNQHFVKAFEDAMCMLTSIQGELHTQTVNHGEFQGMMEDMLHENEGNMTEDQIYNIVGIYAGKTHAIIMRWYEERILENHFIDQTANVRMRYKDKLEDTMKGWRGELRSPRYRGKSLVEWDPDDFLETYYEDVFRLMYSIQSDIAYGREPLYQPRELEGLLDRRQSQLMGAARQWCRTGLSFKECVIASGYSTRERAGDVEWLS